MADALVVGTALTAQGLLGLVRAVRSEQEVAGKAPRMALVDAFASLDFATGKKRFAEARKLATEDAGGNAKNADNTRLSEAHAIFTAWRLAGLSFKDLEGLGWQPSVTLARSYLERANLTVAGNPAKSDEERAAEKAKREAATVRERAMDALPDQGEQSDEEYARVVADTMRKAREERAEELANKAIPEAVIALSKALAELQPLFDTFLAAEDAQRKSWLALPAHVRENIGEMGYRSGTIIRCGIEIAQARQAAADQLKQQRKAEAEIKADAEHAKNLRRVA